MRTPLLLFTCLQLCCESNGAPPHAPPTVAKAMELRFAVVDEPADPSLIRAISGITDGLIKTGASVTHASGFDWGSAGAHQTNCLPLVGYGADLIVGLRRVDRGLHVRMVDTTSAPLLDSVLAADVGKSGLKGLVKEIIQRANTRYPYGCFDLIFKGLEPSQEDHLAKLLHTLPGVQRADILVRHVGPEGRTVSRWQLWASDTSNVQLSSRVQAAVQAVWKAGGYSLDGRVVPIASTAWFQLDATIIGSRSLVFEAAPPPVPVSIQRRIPPVEPNLPSQGPRPPTNHRPNQEPIVIPTHPDWTPWK